MRTRCKWGTFEDVLIPIIVAAGLAGIAAAAGAFGGRRDPEPALIPVPVDRPRRPRR